MNIYKWPLTIVLIVLPLCMMSCMAAEKSPENNISAIEFQVAEQNIDQFGFDLSRPEIEKRVVNNLTGWHFPLVLNSKNYTHRLVAKLGKIAKQSTPVGFSFSSGNSDPRAVEFQKAEVLPVDCRLINLATAGLVAERQSSFNAHALTSEAGEAKTMDNLVDSISTACYDVLDELKLPVAKDKTDTAVSKPSWMPSVRVEEKPLDEPADSKKPVENTNETQNETRKQIIIHNQGSPVILKFGHERQ